MAKVLKFTMIASILTLGFEMSVWAGQAVESSKQWRSMIVTDKCDNEYRLNMSDKARIIFNDGNMVITDYISSIDICLSDIMRWEMSEMRFPEDIFSRKDDIVADNVSLISYNCNKIKVVVSEGTDELRIVDMSGKVVLLQEISDVAYIDTDKFASGVYIVIVGRKSLKIVVK